MNLRRDSGGSALPVNLTALGIARQALSGRFAVVTLLAVAGLFASDWFRPVQRFWTSHAMVSAVVSGLLFAAFAIYVIQGWSAETDRVHTARTRAVAYSGLQHELRLLRDGLRLVVTGKAPTPEGAPVVDRRAKAIDRFFSDFPGLPSEPDGGPMQIHARLKALAADPDWTTLVFPAMVELKVAAQRQIATWASLMLSSSVLSESLNRVSSIVDAFDVLQRPLMPRHCDAWGCIRAERLDYVIALWEEIVTACVWVEEDLQRVVWPVWRSGARNQLCADGQARLAKAHPDHGVSESYNDDKLNERTKTLANAYLPAYDEDLLRQRQDEEGRAQGLVTVPASPPI